MIIIKHNEDLNFVNFQERCILDGTLTVNYEQVETEYRLRHNDLLANIVHRLVKLKENNKRDARVMYCTMDL